MWWYRHPSFAVTAGGSWFSRFPLVTPLFIYLTHRLRKLVCRVCRTVELTRRREFNQASPDQLSYEARSRRSRPTIVRRPLIGNSDPFHCPFNHHVEEVRCGLNGVICLRENLDGCVSIPGALQCGFNSLDAYMDRNNIV